MHIERLIKMANDISNFFAAEPDKETAINGVKLHIQRSWETRMRSAIIDYVQTDGAGLSDLAKEAVSRLQA
jgi:formate dehydrogenase subunit delta